MAARKTAWEKMRCGKSPVVVRDLPAAMERGIGKWFPPGTPPSKRTMLVSSPEEVEQFIAAIPPGQVVRMEDMRAELAARHGATICCPLTAAIFANIVARAYAEREAETGEASIGWWRLLASKGKLNPKYPGGTVEQARRLAAEGIVLPTGKSR